MNRFHIPGCCLRARRMSAALLSAVLTFAVCTAIGSLLIVPGIRSAEASENGPAKERNEDASFAVRLGSERQSSCERRHDRSTSACHMPTRVGYEHLPAVFPFSGHRLSNGLLAPLTC